MTTAKLILRLLWLPFALLFAALAAIAVIATLGQERLVQWLAQNRGGAGRDEIADLILVLRLGWELVPALASGFTVLPVIALVAIGEVARIRSALYYVAGGGAALAVIPLLARFGSEAGAPLVLWQVMATAGFAGGLVYWLLAGRSA